MSREGGKNTIEVAESEGGSQSEPGRIRRKEVTTTPGGSQTLYNANLNSIKEDSRTLRRCRPMRPRQLWFPVR